MLRDSTIKSRLIFMISFLSLMLIGIGAIGLVNLSSGNVALKSIYENRLVPMGDLDTIVRLIDQSRMDVAESMNGDPAVVTKKMDEVDKRIETINKQCEAYAARSLASDERKLTDKF